MRPLTTDATNPSPPKKRIGARLKVSRNQTTSTSSSEIGMRASPNLERPARRFCHGVGTSPIR